VGKLPANLFNGRDHQLRDAAVALLEKGDMKRLVVVSNRVVNPECKAAGGLAVCILDGLRERGGLWFGWNGEIVADESGVAVACTRYDKVTIVTMPLTERDYQEYYLGFCNAGVVAGSPLPIGSRPLHAREQRSLSTREQSFRGDARALVE